MHRQSNSFIPVSQRDGIHPSHVAEQRPLATRVEGCCNSYLDEDCTPSDAATDRFNHQLRDQPLRGERG